MILSPPRSVRVSTCGFFPSLFMLWNKLFSIRIRCPLKAQEDSLATWRVPGSSELAFPVSGVVFSVLTSHRKVYSSKKKMEGGTKTRLDSHVQTSILNRKFGFQLEVPTILWQSKWISSKYIFCYNSYLDVFKVLLYFQRACKRKIFLTNMMNKLSISNNDFINC